MSVFPCGYFLAFTGLGDLCNNLVGSNQEREKEASDVYSNVMQGKETLRKVCPDILLGISFCDAQ